MVIERERFERRTEFGWVWATVGKRKKIYENLFKFDVSEFQFSNFCRAKRNFNNIIIIFMLQFVRCWEIRAIIILKLV